MASAPAPSQPSTAGSRTGSPRACAIASIQVAVRRSTVKRFVHPVVGELELDCEVLLSAEHAQRLIVHTAAPGSESAERLELLRVVGLQDLTPSG